MIWQFGELGYDYEINYDCRTCKKPVRWDYFQEPARKKLYETWATLINYRRENPCFRSRDFHLIVGGAGKRIEINHEDKNLRIIGNFGVEPLAVDPNFNTGGWWQDVLSGSSFWVEDVNQPVLLEPGEFHLFASLSVPSSTKQGIPPRFSSGKEGFRVWPTPTPEVLNFTPASESATLTFMDLTGKVVEVQQTCPWQDQAEISSLREGIYILKRSFSNGVEESVKLVKTDR
jgi:hypothetical protein